MVSSWVFVSHLSYVCFFSFDSFNGFYLGFMVQFLSGAFDCETSGVRTMFLRH